MSGIVYVHMYVCVQGFIWKNGQGGGKTILMKKWGGGKGSEHDSAPSRGSGDMTRFLVFISRITFLGGTH